jgi:hypothetical protein
MCFGHLYRRESPANWLMLWGRDRLAPRRARDIGGTITDHSMDEKGDVTRLLAAIAGGDHAAWHELFPLV